MGRFVVPFIVVITVPIVFKLFRRMAPRQAQSEAVQDDGRRLPFGVAGLCMCMLAFVVGVGGFFMLHAGNRLWGALGRGAIMTTYPGWVIWCFAPGFAALLVPWLTTLWLLRRFGYAGQAAQIVAKGNENMNIDGEKVMRGMLLGIVLPIAIFTVPAIPMHMTVTNQDVKVTHYGHIFPETFRFADARSAWFVDGYTLRDGTFQDHLDLLIDFADGRRLSANAVGDGGTELSIPLARLLLEKSMLKPTEVRTENDIR